MKGGECTYLRRLCKTGWMDGWMDGQGGERFDRWVHACPGACADTATRTAHKAKRKKAQKAGPLHSPSFLTPLVCVCARVLMLYDPFKYATVEDVEGIASRKASVTATVAVTVAARTSSSDETGPGAGEPGWVDLGGVTLGRSHPERDSTPVRSDAGDSTPAKSDAGDSTPVKKSDAGETRCEKRKFGDEGIRKPTCASHPPPRASTSRTASGWLPSPPAGAPSSWL
eukprot:298432-Chlamydomonas_euryale.AAC.1